MTRRHSAALMALGAWLLTITIIAPLTPARADVGAGYSFKDGFSSNQYNGNDGSDEFDGPWWESLDWGGSNKGAVSVVEDGDCPRISCARIGGETRFWGAGLARRANLQDAHNATMKFRYRLAVDQASDGYLNVAAFDGWNWTILDSIALDDADGEVHSRSYNVAGYATKFFSVGFFAHGEWSGAAFIDDVEVFGKWQDTTTTTESSTTSTTTTTVAPTTTSSAPTTTSVTSTTSTTTVAPTTTTVPPTVTTRPPSVTTRPPSVTTRPPSVTTHPPSVTTISPTSTLAPTSPPTTTRPPSTEAPLFKDERYKDKGALAFFVFDDELTNGTAELATMPGEVALPKPGPVTQIMASITVTAVTIRSHLLSAIALGLLIAAAAVIGLGRRNEPA